MQASFGSTDRLGCNGRAMPLLYHGEELVSSIMSI